MINNLEKTDKYFYTKKSVYSFKLETIKEIMKLNGYKVKIIFSDNNGKPGDEITIKL